MAIDVTRSTGFPLANKGQSLARKIFGRPAEQVFSEIGLRTVTPTVVSRLAEAGAYSRKA